MTLLDRYDAFLFDMGNTLLDFHKGSTDAEKDDLGLERLSGFLSDYFRLRITTEHLKKTFFQPWTADFCKRSEHGIELDVEHYLNGSLVPFNCELSSDVCFEAMKLFFSEFERQVVVNPQAHEVLKSIKEHGKKIAVVSNCTLYAGIFIDVFASAGLGKFIDAYAFSYTFGVRKPNRILFQEALSLLGSAPESSIMIGDSVEADLIGANGVGVETVWYNKGLKSNSTLFNPSYVIRDFSELLLA